MARIKTRRTNLTETTCKICGKSIMTIVNTFIGTAEMQQKYGRICSGCFGNELLNEMEHDYRNLKF